MKLLTEQKMSKVRPFLFVIALQILFVSTAAADIRQDADAVHASLHQNSAVENFSDDMKSLDLVFEIAERYSTLGDRENADKFYLLVLQKARIVESFLKAPDTLPQSANKPQEQVASADEEQTDEAESDLLVGTKGVYTVLKADTVRLVAAKLGVTQQHLRSMNNLDAKAHLKVGQKLAYDNRKIIPQQVKNGIIVNIPDRTLYYFQQGTLVASLPVALGSPTKNEKYVWQTPVGKFKITAKIKDPTWTVPPSIQTEMEEQGKDVVTSIPPGPENPLGKFALRTSIPGIMIHSTTKPSSIYSFSSHGCIRISPQQMEAFFPQIKVNTRGEIIYRPIKLAVTESGRVFLEVHNDVYSKSSSLVTEARQMVEKLKLSEQVDWEKFKTVVKQRRGVAEDISL
jgi:lipoprotein-anchoring transpeptidase ErfK/SrfK